jgi:hypothetical protein
MRLWGMFIALAACHARLDDPDLVTDGQGMLESNDSGQPITGDGAIANPDGAASLGPWGPAAKIAGASSATNSEDDSTMTWGVNELVWAVQAGGTGNKRLYAMTYANGTFGTPAALSFSAGVVDDESPRFSTDDLTLYFGSTRGNGALQIYSSHRTTTTSAWMTPAPVAGPSTTVGAKWYAPCDLNHYLVVQAVGSDTDIFEGVVGAPPVSATPLNSTSADTSAFMTKDCLTVYFASNRTSATTGTDLYTAHRAAVTDPWPSPTLMTDFNTTDNEEDPWISEDQRTFVFARSAIGGQKDLYISTR